jgi:hypothetical protein
MIVPETLAIAIETEAQEMKGRAEYSSMSFMPARHKTALALFLALAASHPAAAAPAIGNAVQISTTVSAGGRALHKSSPLYFNDIVKSNATGLGQFVFDDGTRLAMGPSATVVIDKSIYKGGNRIQRASLQATKGAFRYISGAFSGHKVATPYGTIGIRGTAFDFTIRNGRVHVLLFRGAVDFCSGGSCQTLKRRCDYLVGGGGKITKPQPLSSGIGSGLNVAQAFPLLVNQGRLTSQFRQNRSACLGRVVRDLNRLSPKVQASAAPEPPGSPAPPGPPAPGPSGKGNKGFGNGEERNATREANNPGQGKGGPHSP